MWFLAVLLQLVADQPVYSGSRLDHVVDGFRGLVDGGWLLWSDERLGLVRVSVDSPFYYEQEQVFRDFLTDGRGVRLVVDSDEATVSSKDAVSASDASDA